MLTNFQNFDQFSKFWPILKLLANFQNINPISKFWHIFKILTHVQDIQEIKWSTLDGGCSFNFQRILKPENGEFSEISPHVGVDDTFWLFIFTLNRAKKWFNSIFNSKLNRRYSFNELFIQYSVRNIDSMNYSFNIQSEISIQNFIQKIE